MESEFHRVVIVKVNDPRLVSSGIQTYIDYEVHTSWKIGESSRWNSSSVRRRYRDFAWLNEELKAARKISDDVPLPQKNWFGNLSSSYTNKEMIELRRKELDDYLKNVISESWEEPSLHMFLGGGDHIFQEGKINLDSIRRYLNTPVNFYLEDEVQKAVYTLLNMIENYDLEDIASELLDGCSGIAFVTTLKGGFMYSGRMGTGIVIARLPSGTWSAPSAIGVVGAGWGFQAGCEVSDMMLILPDQSSVDLFTSSVQFGVGSELSVCLGPMGRAVETVLSIGDKGSSTNILAYSYSKGIFMGVSVQLSCIMSRPDLNKTFYGEDFSVTQILDGSCPPPLVAAPLYRALARARVDFAHQHRRSLHLSPDGVYFDHVRAFQQHSLTDGDIEEEVEEDEEERAKPNLPSLTSHPVSLRIGKWRRNRDCEQRQRGEIIRRQHPGMTEVATPLPTIEKEMNCENEEELDELPEAELFTESGILERDFEV